VLGLESKDFGFEYLMRCEVEGEGILGIKRPQMITC